jgi:hypothetical protein
MPYSITISFNQNYIHALVEGSNTIKNVAQYLSDIQKAVVEHSCTTVLIEDHLDGPGLDTFDLFEIIRTQARYARDHKLRLAYVDLNKDHHRTTVAFAENLANILGVNVKVFSTAGEAKEWLVPAKSS